MSTNAEDTKKDLKQKGRVENASPPAPPPRLVEPIEYGPPRPIAQLLPVLNLENLPLYKNAPVKTKGPESTDDLSPIALNNDETEKLQISSTIENQLKKILPAGYQLNCTPNNYDSWWESVACYLNHLIGSNKSFSVESLRLLVSDIVKNEKNRPDWFTPDLLLEYGYTEGLYLARISESVAQMKEHNRRLTLIGDAMPGSDIEARLLCTKFPITIHCIEIADDGEFRETITNSESTDEIEPLNREDYINENNMVHLVVYKNHVMPLINYHAKPKFDPNLISSVQELARSTKIPLDRSRRSSSYSPKSKVVRAVEELFATEKQYHERLKHFALKKVPGKIAKPKKSLWQKFSAVIGLSTNANEYKPQLHTWPEIKKIAITQPNLGKFIGNLDEFVSNYTNPENDEKEVVYSTETVNKVKRSWKIIKNDLLEHHLSTHYQSYQFDKIINQPLIGPFPPALVKFEKFLKDNKENRARIDEEGPEFLITCLKNNLPSGWEALKEFLIKNNIWNDAIHKPCELFILNLHPFDEFINTSTSNSLPGGWERLKQLLNDNKLYSSEVIEHFEPFVSKYTGLAQSPHAFSEIDSLEDNKEYSHLTQQGVTDENICEWVDIIYDAVIGKPKEITIKDPITEEEKKVIRQGSKLEPIFKNMAVISVYYDHLLRLKKCNK